MFSVNHTKKITLDSFSNKLTSNISNECECITFLILIFNTAPPYAHVNTTSDGVTFGKLPWMGYYELISESAKSPAWQLLSDDVKKVKSYLYRDEEGRWCISSNRDSEHGPTAFSQEISDSPFTTDMKWHYVGGGEEWHENDSLQVSAVVGKKYSSSYYWNIFCRGAWSSLINFAPSGGFSSLFVGTTIP